MYTIFPKHLSDYQHIVISDVYIVSFLFSIQKPALHRLGQTRSLPDQQTWCSPVAVSKLVFAPSSASPGHLSSAVILFVGSIDISHSLCNAWSALSLSATALSRPHNRRSGARRSRRHGHPQWLVESHPMPKWRWMQDCAVSLWPSRRSAESHGRCGSREHIDSTRANRSVDG